METYGKDIGLFLQKCDEVMQSKFIIADTKIGELLKSIATSDLLYALFRDITKDFDYTAAQKKYMNYLPEGTFGRRKLLFPEDPVERLAFVFCLLVDFDTGRIDLGGFLQEAGIQAIDRVLLDEPHPGEASGKEERGLRLRIEHR